MDMISQTPKFKTTMQELILEMTSHRDEHEIFVALYGLVSFMGDDIEIGFVLSPQFIPGRDRINSIEDLFRFRQTHSDIDFIVKRSDGEGEFQLKRFKRVLNTENLIAELERVIRHYGNKLGDVNLLFIMQQSKTEGAIDFQKISERLAAILPTDDPAQILLRFRDDESDIIVSLHPKLGKSIVPIQLPSQILDRLAKKTNGSQ